MVHGTPVMSAGYGLGIGTPASERGDLFFPHKKIPQNRKRFLLSSTCTKIFASGDQFPKFSTQTSIPTNFGGGIEVLWRAQTLTPNSVATYCSCSISRSQQSTIINKSPVPLVCLLRRTCNQVVGSTAFLVYSQHGIVCTYCTARCRKVSMAYSFCPQACKTASNRV
jgi:hypothetical protein